MAAKEAVLDLFLGMKDIGTPLSTFQRVLLMTDGTVTDILEVYTREIIRVVILNQSLVEREPETPQLNDLGIERLLFRTVLLQGTASGTNFIHADSVVAPDRLPPSVLTGLLETGTPIGRLLAQERIETFREIVGLAFEPAGECADYFGVDPTSNLIARTYRIHVNRRPVMRITEKFPVTWFAEVVN